MLLVTDQKDHPESQWATRAREHSGDWRARVAQVLEGVREAAATAMADGLRWPFLEVPVVIRLLRRETVRSSFADDALMNLAGG